MEKVTVFIDYESLSTVLEREKLQIDLLALRDYLAEGRILTEVFCYPGFTPVQEDDLWDSLMMNGFLVRFRAGRSDNPLKGDTSIQLVMDVVDYATVLKPNIVVIVTGARNYASLANWLRFRGIRVEVASTESGISENLRRSANGFIDLCHAIGEIHGVRESGAIPREEVMKDAGSDR